MDQRRFKMRRSGNVFAYFKEVAPFHLGFDECGEWLEWAKFPTPCDAEIKALTPKNPKIDPKNPLLKRGISGFLHVDGLAEVWDYYLSKLKKSADPNADGVLIPFEDCKNFMGSILGDKGV